MALGLFLLLSDGIPNLGDEGEAIMISVQNDDDLEVTPPPDGGEMDPRSYGCVTTLVANYDDWDRLRQDFENWWRGIAETQAVLELLATDIALVSEDQRSSLVALERHSWSVRTPVVLFSKQQPEAEAEARRFVRESALSQN